MADLPGPTTIVCFNAFPIAPGVQGEEAVIGFETTALGPAMLVSLSGAPIVVAVNLDLADDEVAVGGPILGGGGPGGTRQLFRGRDLGDSTSAQEVVPVLADAQALSGLKAEDTAFADGDVGAMALAVRRDADAPDAADGDYTPLHTDASGFLKTTGAISGTVAVGPTVTPGTGAANLGKAEDAVAGSGDVGVMALVVRRDADAADGADGDYVALHTDAVGRLKVDDIGSGPSQDAVLAVTAVAAVSVAIAAADATRRAITIQNRGPGPLYVNPSGAALVTHFRLGNGDSKTFQHAAGSAWTGISNGAGASAVVITEDE